MKTGRKNFKAMEAMLKEREELLKHHEVKVVHFRNEFEKKLAGLAKKEAALAAREKELKGLQKSTGHLLRNRSLLEKRCQKLSHEEHVFRGYIARGQKEVEKLHHEDARKRAELRSFQKKLDSLKSQFDSIYSNADRITTSLKTREAELRRVTRALEEAEARHRNVISKITYHSKAEIRSSVKSAEKHLKQGLVGKAREEYERIRNFYAHLPHGDKRKVYSSIEKIRVRLSSGSR